MKKISCDFATKLALGGYKMTVEAVVSAHERTGLSRSVVRVAQNLSVQVETTSNGFKVAKV